EVCLLGKKKSKKLIISEHGSKFGYNNIYNYIKKLVYPRAFKISVPTTLDTRLYLEEGYPAVFIPHISTFSRQEKNLVYEKVILNIGRLTQDKRQIDLLRIWNEIVKEKADQGWRLKIVGRGEEKENLANYIDANNLNNSVEILEPIKDVDQFFKMASIFAFTSQFEGFGMVLLEAMSFGVPCISFDCPSGPRDIIDDGVNGFLIENRNIEIYKEKLLELMENEELRKKYSQSSFQKANNWDNESILKKWNSIFDDVQ
ncbi:TPA: glycosyltransferase, partial [Streptococcus suis]